MSVVNTLKELAIEAWKKEPAVIVGLVASAVVGGLTLVGLSVPLTTVTTVVTVVLGAIVTRLRVTPTSKVVPVVPVPPPAKQ